ncbi:MAG: TlpA disulfide reductase family protein [Polyangiaceae bacterium]
MQLKAAAHISMVVAAAIGCSPASGSLSAAPSPDLSPDRSTATSAPDFSASELAGKPFHLRDHIGKEVIVLDFWATYCEPCKSEFPHLRSMYKKDRDRGLLVVGVSMDGPETAADVSAFVRRFELDFPVVLDEDSRIARLYNPKKSMPLSVIIDRTGRIAVVREGFSPGDEKLVALDVERALSEPQPTR